MIRFKYKPRSILKEILDPILKSKDIIEVGLFWLFLN